MIIVEHDMDFMRQWADSVTVLHAGAVLSEGSVAQVQADPKVQEVYLGTGTTTNPTIDAVIDPAIDPAAELSDMPPAEPAASEVLAPEVSR